MVNSFINKGKRNLFNCTLRKILASTELSEALYRSQVDPVDLQQNSCNESYLYILFSSIGDPRHQKQAILPIEQRGPKW